MVKWGRASTITRVREKTDAHTTFLAMVIGNRWGRVGSGTMKDVLRHLRQAALGSEDAPSDGPLLEAFIARGDGAAFAALLRRHGPMVLGVCRRVLGNVHDAEDAFQASFLILARKANSIHKSEAVGSWLYGVAYRVAVKARARSAARQTRERQAGQRA